MPLFSVKTYIFLNVFKHTFVEHMYKNTYNVQSSKKKKRKEKKRKRNTCFNFNANYDREMKVVPINMD